MSRYAALSLRAICLQHSASQAGQGEEGCRHPAARRVAAACRCGLLCTDRHALLEARANCLITCERLEQQAEVNRRV
jgi:hypothetical protein